METSKTSIELEHAIGFSGFVHSSVYFHPNGRDYVTVSGGCIGMHIYSVISLVIPKRSFLDSKWIEFVEMGESKRVG
jgi:hypothetical protein